MHGKSAMTVQKVKKYLQQIDNNAVSSYHSANLRLSWLVQTLFASSPQAEREQLVMGIMKA